MIPGVTASKVTHVSYSPTVSHSYDLTSSSGIGQKNQVAYVATDGSGTIAMPKGTSSSASVLVYTKDYGQTWAETPGTEKNNGPASIIYALGNWVVSTRVKMYINFSTDVTGDWSSWNEIGSGSTSTYEGLLVTHPDASNPSIILISFVDQSPKLGWSNLDTISNNGTTLLNSRNDVESLVWGTLGGSSAWFLCKGGNDNLDKLTGSNFGTRTIMSAPSTVNGEMDCLYYFKDKNLWVLSGTNAQIWTSPDNGSDFNWTARTYGGSHDIESMLAIGNGKLILTGNSDTIYVMTAASTFTSFTLSASSATTKFEYDGVESNKTAYYPQVGSTNQGYAAILVAKL